MRSIELSIGHGGSPDEPTWIIQIASCSNPPLEVVIDAEWSGATGPLDVLDESEVLLKLWRLAAKMIEEELPVQQVIGGPCAEHLVLGCPDCADEPF